LFIRICISWKGCAIYSTVLRGFCKFVNLVAVRIKGPMLAVRYDD